jgi:hypothetical protein
MAKSQMSMNHTRIAMKSTCLKQTAVALALALGLGATSAHAQYIWLNEQGVKQFSDMPPPASVPKNRILKSPSGERPAASADTPAPAAGAKSNDKDRGPMTTAELEADYKKRKMAQAKDEKKAADEQQAAADKAKNCESTRAYARTLESGDRVTKMDKNGEKTYVNDEQRARDLQEAKRRLAEC